MQGHKVDKQNNPAAKIKKVFLHVEQEDAEFIYQVSSRRSYDFIP